MSRFRFRKNAKTDTPLSKKHARVLKIVSAINAVMFVVEASTGYLAHSMAMISDSIDMLGDAVGAGTGVLVRNSPPRTQAKVALAKAVGMGLLGLGVLAAAGLLIVNPVVMPVAATMAIVGGTALVANTTCALLLYRYRNDNINIKSTLICTRNDMVSNAGVLTAAALSHFLLTPIPDIIVGVAVAGLFIKSSIGIARESIKILRAPENAPKENSNTAATSLKTAPKMTHGFKKIIRNVFNRKAEDTKQTPVAAPAKNPVLKTQPVL